ncbi:MAG: DUF624 domain-containing protein [Oscillospiraceae bacterium]|jgi:uncharacterized membrane protein YesL|nr:DUF624 domain-containing protein [Oscillospiraceae bacterium]
MPIFSRNFNRPGPGVPKDAPRKKGVARFFELLFRDFFDLVKLNLLFSIILLPSLTLFVLNIMGVFGAFSLFVLLLSLVLAYPIGGALTAYVYYITKMMRDDPSYVWYEFKRKFKENHKQAAVSGLVCMVFIYTQIFVWATFYIATTEGGTIDLFLLLSSVIALFFFTMIAPYVFMQFSYLELSSLKVFRNSVMLTFAYLPRSFMGAVQGLIIWIIFALQMPYSIMMLPFVFLVFISLSMLLGLSWVWKPFNEQFEIEETLKKRLAEENQAEKVIDD